MQNRPNFCGKILKVLKEPGFEGGVYLIKESTEPEAGVPYPGYILVPMDDRSLEMMQKMHGNSSMYDLYASHDWIFNSIRTEHVLLNEANPLLMEFHDVKKSD